MVETVLDILARVPDPEIPVLSVVDLGIVREVRDDAVVITPTYTGCPATLAIEAGIRAALDASGHGDMRIETVLSPPWTTSGSARKAAGSSTLTASRRRRIHAPPVRNAHPPTRKR